MKREEALNSFYCIEASTDGVELVNEIYDSLDKQKCQNCRYANLDSSRYLAIHKCSMGVSAIDYDFGCSYIGKLRILNESNTYFKDVETRILY